MAGVNAVDVGDDLAAPVSRDHLPFDGPLVKASDFEDPVTARTEADCLRIAKSRSRYLIEASLIASAGPGSDSDVTAGWASCVKDVLAFGWHPLTDDPTTKVHPIDIWSKGDRGLVVRADTNKALKHFALTDIAWPDPTPLQALWLRAAHEWSHGSPE